MFYYHPFFTNVQTIHVVASLFLSYFRPLLIISSFSVSHLVTSSPPLKYFMSIAHNLHFNVFDNIELSFTEVSSQWSEDCLLNYHFSLLTNSLPPDQLIC